MSIGQHKLGKAFIGFRASIGGGLNSLFSSRTATLPQTQAYNVDGITADSLPRSPANPYRKRPVKIVYDKNDFHMFRLPSEKAFLLGSFDSHDIFGARKGIQHSPHIRAQMNLDTNLVWAFMIVSTVAMIIENKRTHKFVTLRENMLHSDKGWFKVEDFN